jgi:hypothetical protein
MLISRYYLGFSSTRSSNYHKLEVTRQREHGGPLESCDRCAGPHTNSAYKELVSIGMSVLGTSARLFKHQFYRSSFQ